MSYSISITGHGASNETIKRAFSDAIRTLRTEGGTISGKATGSNEFPTITDTDVPDTGDTYPGIQDSNVTRDERRRNPATGPRPGGLPNRRRVVDTEPQGEPKSNEAPR